MVGTGDAVSILSHNVLRSESEWGAARAKSGWARPSASPDRQLGYSPRAVHLKHATSFANEHTVEYAVVDAVRAIFAAVALPVVPVFFWKSREGGKIAREMHGTIDARLIAIFPRRPRPYGQKLDQVGWKINGELHAYAQEANDRGVPTFAALPVARSLMALAAQPPVHWHPLSPKPCADRWLSASQGAQGDAGSAALLQAMATSVYLPWDELVEVMSDLREATSTHQHFFGFGGYRPVYFLVPQPHA